MMLRGMYNEIVADLYRKGMGGIVEQVDHDYKNGSMTTPTSVVDTYTPLKTKNQNERATASIHLCGGPSLPISEVTR